MRRGISSVLWSTACRGECHKFGAGCRTVAGMYIVCFFGALFSLRENSSLCRLDCPKEDTEGRCRLPRSVPEGVGAGCRPPVGGRQAEVVIGVLEEECEALNRTFMTCQIDERPFVTLKWARVGTVISTGSGKLRELAIRISDDVSSVWVHRLRAEADAILVGTNTAVADNPSLTTRLWYGRSPCESFSTNMPAFRLVRTCLQMDCLRLLLRRRILFIRFCPILSKLFASLSGKI